MNEPGTGATFRKQSSVAILAATIIAFATAIAIALTDATNASHVATWLAAGTVLQIIILIAAHAVLAARTTSEPDDERDHAINRRATSRAAHITTIAAVLAVVALIAQQLTTDAKPESVLASPLLVALGLTAAVAIAECVRHASIAFAYTRGA